MIEIDEKVLKQPKKTSLIIFATITALIYIIYTVFLAVGIIEALTTPTTDNWAGVGVALFYVFFVIIFGSIFYGADIILAIIGLIISHKKRKQGLKKGFNGYFIVMCILPLLTLATAHIIMLLA